MTRSALTPFFAVGLMGALHGCHPEDCEETLTCHITCDPSVELIEYNLEACDPTFVSSTMGSDANPGSHGAPVSTLSKAIALAQTRSGVVFACAETFAESVTIPSGVELWGGVDCAAGWLHVTGKKTTITPEPGAIPLRFMSGPKRSIVADVHAEATDAPLAGQSSIAALVNAGAVVEIIRSELVAGDGAAGARGGTETLPAKEGEAGAPGNDACTASTVPGGEPIVNSCRGVTSIGAQGGYGSPTQAGSGANGQPEPVPNPLGQGLGGPGQMSGFDCDDGAPGAWGANGDHGRGASGPGSISEEGWLGVPGQDGGDGRPGQGGGGGGGSRAGAVFCGAAPQGGASGGGGGAGGCGGLGGKGGGYGGGSIGLLALSGAVTIRDTTITTRAGVPLPGPGAVDGIILLQGSRLRMLRLLGLLNGGGVELEAAGRESMPPPARGTAAPISHPLAALTMR